MAEGQAIGGADVYWKWCGERFEGRMRTESVVIDSPVLGKPLGPGSLQEELRARRR